MREGGVAGSREVVMDGVARDVTAVVVTCGASLKPAGDNYIM